MLHYDRITPQLLSSVCNMCDVGLLLLSRERGIVFWNKWLEGASGIEKKDVLGKTLNEVFPKVESSRLAQAIDDVFSYRLSSIMSPRLNGIVFPLTSIKNVAAKNHVDMAQLTTINPLITETGQVYCLIQITDVTNAITREDTLRQQTTALSTKTAALEIALQSEKIFATLQSKFVSLVSHEFRTPLAIIDGAAQRLIRNKDTIDPDGIHDRCGIIRRAIKRVTGLMDATLYASRIDEDRVELTKTTFDLRALVQGNCDHQADLTQSHKIDANLSGLPTSVHADEKLMSLVFTNLLSNAAKYAPHAPLIKVKGWSRDGMAIISVTDHGEGISKDDLSNMFVRFFRTKSAEGIAGTGIGLSISKEFVEMHGGAIELESTEGKGSTFTVHLPIGL